MPDFKGKRTIIFNALMGLFALLGLHLSPELVSGWAAVFAAVWAGGGILLRIVTDTPALARLAAPVEASLGHLQTDLSPVMEGLDRVMVLLAQTPHSQAASGEAAADNTVADLAKQVGAMAEHPLFGLSGDAVAGLVRLVTAMGVGTVSIPQPTPTPVALQQPGQPGTGA